MDSPETRHPRAGERRNFSRVDILLTGVLSYGDGIEDCVVRDLSVNGAMIDVDRSPAPGLPATLEIARLGGFRGRDKDLAGRALHAEVAWRGNGRAGLRFTEKPHEIAEVMTGFLRQAGLDSGRRYL